MIVMHGRHWNHTVTEHKSNKTRKIMQDMVTHHTISVCSNACAVLSGALALHFTEVNAWQSQSRSHSVAYVTGKMRRKSWFNTVYCLWMLIWLMNLMNSYCLRCEYHHLYSFIIYYHHSHSSLFPLQSGRRNSPYEPSGGLWCCLRQ